MSERLINSLLAVVTGGRVEVKKNPGFEKAMTEIEKEKRNFVTRVYDAGTLFVVDDANQTIIPRFVLCNRR